MRLSVLVCCSLLFSQPGIDHKPSVMLGCDRLLGSEFSIVRDKRVGIITNQSGRLSRGTFLVDTLIARGVNVVALFAPEHGIRADAAAGESVGDTQDARTGIPIYSLYGVNHKPTAKMLGNIELLIYDIQDVGVRYYTYLSTMVLGMESAAEMGIRFVVCDRPNPLGGLWIDGPVREDSLRSFVGMLKIPIIYGLTCGELARLVNDEGWLSHGIHADLHVITMDGWSREILWEGTGFRWNLPSPNIRTSDAAFLYPGTCLFEATNVSEGRGTEKPFQIIGAPFVDNQQLCSLMVSLNLPGVRFSPVSFTPTSSKFRGKLCYGLAIEVTDRHSIDPLRICYALIQVLRSDHPHELVINERSFNRLSGQAGFLRSLLAGENYDSVKSGWKADIAEFRQISAQCRLYPER